MTLDCERVWKVACDRLGCHRRLYLAAETAQEASIRAAREYVWSGLGGGGMLCTVHKQEVP